MDQIGIIDDGIVLLKAAVSPEPYDDENGNGYRPLERWGDRRYHLRRRDWREESNNR